MDTISVSETISRVQETLASIAKIAHALDHGRGINYAPASMAIQQLIAELRELVLALSHEKAKAADYNRSLVDKIRKTDILHAAKEELLAQAKQIMARCEQIREQNMAMENQLKERLGEARRAQMQLPMPVDVKKMDRILTDLWQIKGMANQLVGQAGPMGQNMQFVGQVLHAMSSDRFQQDKRLQGMEIKLNGIGKHLERVEEMLEDEQFRADRFMDMDVNKIQPEQMGATTQTFPEPMSATTQAFLESSSANDISEPDSAETTTIPADDPGRTVRRPMSTTEVATSNANVLKSLQQHEPASCASKAAKVVKAAIDHIDISTSEEEIDDEANDGKKVALKEVKKPETKGGNRAGMDGGREIGELRVIFEEPWANQFSPAARKRKHPDGEGNKDFKGYDHDWTKNLQRIGSSPLKKG